MRKNTWLPTIALTLLLSAFFFGFTIWITPYWVAYRVRSKIQEQDNKLLHSERVNPKFQSPGLPNPDFVYSSLVYDLEGGMLKLKGKVADSTYWSLGLYGWDGKNFYTINNNLKEMLSST